MLRYFRKILPGRFSLKAAFKERKRKRSEGSKCGSQLARRPDEDQLSGKISLQTVQKHATLTVIDAGIDTDVHTFVNIAVIWTLSELEFFNRDTLSDEQLRRSGLTSSGLPEDLVSCDYTRTFPLRFGSAYIRISCVYGFSWLLIYTNEARFPFNLLDTQKYFERRCIFKNYTSRFLNARSPCIFTGGNGLVEFFEIWKFFRRKHWRELELICCSNILIFRHNNLLRCNLHFYGN